MDKQTQNELQKMVRRNYDEIAEHYNETRKKHLEPLWSTLVKVAERIEPGSSILDVGCGNGRFLEALAGKPVDYVGIDQSERLLELARERHPGYKFEQADVLNLSGIREYDFDYIFAVAVLHHLPGRKLQIDALKQMRSKVKPDGLIIITVWNMWKQKRFRKLILRNSLLKLIGKNKMDWGDVVFDWKNPKGEAVSRRYYHAFTRRSLKKISRKAGLRIESVMSDNYNYYLLARPRAGK